MVVGAGGVADYADGEEGDMLYGAYLGDGGRLHVDGDGLGAHGEHGGQLGGFADEAVAGGYEAELDAGSGGVDAEEVEGAGEAVGESLHLAGEVAGSAVYIVVGHFGSYYHIEDVGALAGASGDAGLDDGFGVEALDEGERSDGGVDLADAALHGGDPAGADDAAMEGEPVVGDLGDLLHLAEEHGELRRHGYDDAEGGCGKIIGVHSKTFLKVFLVIVQTCPSESHMDSSLYHSSFHTSPYVSIK